MKQLDKKNKILYSVIFLIIVIGVIVTIVAGFNMDKEYSEYQRIEIESDRVLDTDKIEQFSNEVFGKGNAQVKEIEIFKNRLEVSASTISEEQKNNLVEKINNLYKMNEEDKDLINASNVEIISIAKVDLVDIFMPYIIPGVIVVAVISAYILIRYWNSHKFVKVCKFILSAVLSEMVLLSVIAISRFPVGRTTPALMLVVFTIITWMVVEDKNEIIDGKNA